MEKEYDNSQIVTAIENLTDRIGTIENLLKLMLVDGLIRKLDSSIGDAEIIVDKSVEAIILKDGLSVGGYRSINGILVLNIMVPENKKISVNRVRIIENKIKEIDDSLNICFCFKTLHGTKRNQLLKLPVYLKSKRN